MLVCSAVQEFQTGTGACLLRVMAGPGGVERVELNPEGPPPGVQDDGHPVIREALHQLREYFAGRLFHFDLPLEMIGTGFQQRVWRLLLEIPYGETRSYGEIAARIGDVKAVRAVGAANGRNPIAIVVPCHRVIGANGKLVGYGGGLGMKRMLLHLEAEFRAAAGPKGAPPRGDAANRSDLC
jgi:methylated-DNA-[protein]-cysteine S-methyltransferase